MRPLSESPQAADAQRAPGAALIPDGCRLSVALRVLGAALLLAALAAAVEAGSAARWVLRLAEVAMVVAPVAFCSLLAWCGLRRALGGAHPVGQRAAAWLAPALVMLALLLAGVPDSVALPSSRAVALLGVALLAGAVAQHYFELRDRAYSPALVEAKLQALQSRIRPHFLFNSLNAVLAVLRGDPARAERMLEDLSDLFRAAMADARRLVPLEQELDLARKYLAIEQARLGERLRVEWRVEPGPATVRVPPLLLQPLVENAVRYGVERERGECRIEIGVQIEGDSVEVRIANPLAREPAVREGSQIGLANIRERLALIYDLEARLDARAHDGRFEISLRLPLAGPR